MIAAANGCQKIVGTAKARNKYAGGWCGRLKGGLLKAL